MLPRRNDNEWTKKDRRERFKMAAVATLSALAMLAGIGLALYALVTG